MAGRVKPRTDVNSTIFYELLNIMVLPSQMDSKGVCWRVFSVLGKNKTVFKRQLNKRLLVRRGSQPWKNSVRDWLFKINVLCSGEWMWRPLLSNEIVLQGKAGNITKYWSWGHLATKLSWTLGKSSLACFKVSHTCTITFLFPLLSLCHFIFAICLHCYLDSILHVYKIMKPSF